MTLRKLTYDAVVGVDDLVELPDDQGHGLYPLDLFFGADVLSFQVFHLVLDVLFLEPSK